MRFARGPLALVAAALASVCVESTFAQCDEDVVHQYLVTPGASIRLLSPHGAAAIGGSYSLQVVDAPALTIGLLIWSEVEDPVFDPVVGAVLHVGNPYQQIVFATKANGTSRFLLLTPVVRREYRSILAKVGRWLAAEQPTVASPADWTRGVCAAWVAQVTRTRIGDYAQRRVGLAGRVGRQLRAVRVRTIAVAAVGARSPTMRSRTARTAQARARELP